VVTFISIYIFAPVLDSNVSPFVGLRQETGYARGELMLVDLASFASTIAFAKKFGNDDRLDILVMNAGVALFAYEQTTDGYETTFVRGPQVTF
jgi:hypothetical protein